MTTTFRSLTDRAATTLAANVLAADTTLSVAPGTGVLFPASNFLVTLEQERILCTSRTGDVLTVTRAQEGTAAADHAAGVSVEMRVITSLFTDIYTVINAIEAGTDDLTAYAKLAGRTGGQTLFGDTAASGNLNLRSTASATQGAITFEDTDFGVQIVSGNPRIWFHNSGADRQVFDRTNSRFQFIISSTEVVRFVNSGMLAGGYARVGSTADPANTTAGDLTFVRAFVNNDSNFNLQVSASNPTVNADTDASVVYDRTNHWWSFTANGFEIGRFAKDLSSANSNDFTVRGDGTRAGRLSILGPVGSNAFQLFQPFTDANPKLAFTTTASGGRVSFGPGGASALDVNIDRTTMTAPGPTALLAVNDLQVVNRLWFSGNAAWLYTAENSAELAHWGSIHLLIDQDNNDTTRSFGVWHNGASIATASQLLSLDESGNLLNLGYARVGAIAAPANTTAGDLTFTRAFVNNDSNFSLSFLTGNPQIVTDGAGSGGSLRYERTATSPSWKMILPYQGTMFQVSDASSYLTGRSNLTFNVTSAEWAPSGAKQFVTFGMTINSPGTTTTLGANILAGDGTMTVAAGTGANFPGAAFYVQIDTEVIQVNSGFGTDSWGISRGVNGSTAAGHTAGATVALLPGGDFRGLAIEPITNAPIGVNGMGVFRIGGTRLRNAGFNGGVTALVLNGLILDSASVNFQQVASVTGLNLTPVTRVTSNPTGTIPSAVGLIVNDSSSGNYTLSTQLGVDIRALTKGATNIGIRNASEMHFGTIATPQTPAAGLLNQFAQAAATGVLAVTPRFKDENAHDSGTVMRAHTALPRYLNTSYSGSFTSNVLPSAAVSGLTGKVALEQPILLHSIVYKVTAAAVGAGQVVRCAIYSEAGVLITGTNVTDAVGTNTGARTITLGADVYLPAGNYYFFVCSQTDAATTNSGVAGWPDGDTTFATVSDILTGSVVVAAGAAPSPLGTITASGGKTPAFYLVGAAL